MEKIEKDIEKENSPNKVTSGSARDENKPTAPGGKNERRLTMRERIDLHLKELEKEKKLARKVSKNDSQKTDLAPITPQSKSS